MANGEEVEGGCFRTRATADQRGDFVLLGNVLGYDCWSIMPRPLAPADGLTLPDGSDACTQEFVGDDSAFDMYWTFEGDKLKASPQVTHTQASSQAMLELPPGAQVTFARLYWSATIRNTNNTLVDPKPDTQVTLSRTGAGGFSQTLNVNLLEVPSPLWWSEKWMPDKQYDYQSSVDVTELVRKYGRGTYRVSGVDTIPKVSSAYSATQYSAWWMVVIYRDENQAMRSLRVFDGMRGIHSETQEVLVSGFVLPPDSYNAKLGVVAFEGDQENNGSDTNDVICVSDATDGGTMPVPCNQNATDYLLGDNGSEVDIEVDGGLTLNSGTVITKAKVNPANDFFNGSRTYMGKPVSFEGDLPRVSGHAGTARGIDIDVADMSSRLDVDNKTIRISVATSDDIFWLAGIISSVDTMAPDFSNTIKKVTPITTGPRGEVRAGDTLEYAITTTNTGTDTSKDTVLTDALPATLIYVPGSLKITEGANAGNLTDAKGDDVGEFVGSTITVRLGTGATKDAGGKIKVGEKTTVVFRAKVANNPGSVVKNQAVIGAAGEAGAPFKNRGTSAPAAGFPSNPTPTPIGRPPPAITSPAKNSTTSDSTPPISGTAGPGSAVTVYEGGKPICSAVADASGNWTCVPDSPLANGPHTVDAVETDKEGNIFYSQPHPFIVGADITDTDGDGIPDVIEDKDHDGVVDPGETDPHNPDTDGDGLSDGIEDKDHDGSVDPGETDPLNPDTDGDGLQDGIEDKDHDGVVDPGETDPLNPDTDGGGVPDGQEDTNHNGVVDPGERDPLNPADDKDSDNDGVPDVIEGEIGLDPNDADTDDDGIIDGEDGLTDTDKDGAIDALDPDSDNDGLHDGAETGVTRDTAPNGTNVDSDNFQPDKDPSTRTDPKDPDTDDGGLSDGDEAKYNSNPLDDTDDFVIAGRGCSTSGGGSPLMWLAAMLLAVPLMRSRRSSRRGTAAAGGLLGLMGVLSAPAADAQAPTPSPLSQSIDVQRYKPGPGASDILGVHGAKVDGHLGWHLGASLNYANNPLGFLDPRQGNFIYDIVADQVTLDLMGSIALWNRFELGVALPITYQTSEKGPDFLPNFQKDVSGAGLGDLRLVPKARLLSAGRFDLGVVVPVLLPSAGGKSFRGGAGVSARPQLIAEWGNGNGLRLVANLGANLQPAQQVRNLRTGTELMYAVGAQVPFSEKLALRANLAGTFGLRDQDMEERPLELLAAVQYRFSRGLAAHVGGGPGITRGYGTPGFRVFAGFDWTQPGERAPEPPAPLDTDGDGITDDKDQCPQIAEDKDGFLDEDGCPDPDDDSDGIPDTEDKCPQQAETKNGTEDTDGCPDKVTGDADKDGITDDQDKCPQAAEDVDGFQDEDGCPDPDNDKDGVPDWEDQCPVQPEVINGVMDDDGCPDEGKSKVRLESKRIVIMEKVYFATAKDVILPRSFDLLKQVASVLRANPQIELLRVEGHTDNEGKPSSNQKLSQRRAANVRAYLIREGIAAERLEAVGYGEEKPVDSNKTAAGRENNRRVEFNILKVAGQEAEKAQ